MDVFKLAFETTIVGLLTFLWLGIAIDLLFPNFFAQVIPAIKEQNEKVMGVGMLLLAYCLGSAVLPVSSQLVNDEHWPLPDDAIRCRVFLEQEGRLGDIGESQLQPKRVPLGDDLKVCHCSYWGRFFSSYWQNFVAPDEITKQPTFSLSHFWAGLHRSREDKKRDKQARMIADAENDARKLKILTIFQLQESSVLSQGSDKTEQLRQLHERIVVLRGAVFSGFVLCLICLFGRIAPVYGQPFMWKRIVWGAMMALFLTVVIVHNAFGDMKNNDIFDLPILEALVGLLTILGGFLVFKGVKPRPYLRTQSLLMVGFFTALAYGGWMWSEIIYDLQVITSYAVLKS